VLLSSEKSNSGDVFFKIHYTKLDNGNSVNDLPNFTLYPLFERRSLLRSHVFHSAIDGRMAVAFRIQLPRRGYFFEATNDSKPELCGPNQSEAVQRFNITKLLNEMDKRGALVDSDGQSYAAKDIEVVGVDYQKPSRDRFEDDSGESVIDLRTLQSGTEKILDGEKNSTHFSAGAS
jgi:hypothetical protein